MPSESRSSKLKQKYPFLKENASVLILLGVAIAGILATTLLSQRSQDIRKRAAVQDGPLELTLPASGNLAADQTHRLPLTIDLEGETVDGIQIFAFMFGDNTDDITFEPATISGLNLVSNQIYSAGSPSDSTRKGFKLAFITEDPDQPFSQSGTITLGEFVVTNPSDGTDFEFQFQSSQTKILANSSGDELASASGNRTYTFSSGTADPCDPNDSNIIFVSPNTTCNSLEAAFDTIGSDDSGFTIKMAEGSYQHSGFNITASNVQIQPDTEGAQVIVSGSNWFRIVDSSDLNFTGIDFEGTYLQGTVSVFGSNNITFSHANISNTADRIGAFAFEFESSSDVYLQESTITADQTAVMIQDTSNFNINNNVIKDSVTGIFANQISSGNVRNNLIINNSGSGIEAQSVDDLTVAYNTFIKNGGNTGTTSNYSAFYINKVQEETQRLQFTNNLLAFNNFTVSAGGFQELPSTFTYQDNGFHENDGNPTGLGSLTIGTNNNRILDPNFSNNPEADGYCIPTNSPAVFGNREQFDYMGRDNFCADTGDPAYYLDTSPNTNVTLTLNGRDDQVILTALLKDQADNSLVSDYTGLTYDWDITDGSSFISGAAETSCPFGIDEPCPANTFEIQGNTPGTATIRVRVLDIDANSLAEATYTITVVEASQPDEITIKTKVEAVSGDVGPITARVQLGKVGSETALLTTTATLTYETGGFYSTTLSLEGTNVASNQSYWIAVKGEKHIQRVSENLNLFDDPSIDMSSTPLLPGDLPDPEQDSVLDNNDLNVVLARMAKPVQTIDDLNVADVNYDGAVNSIDLGHILNTLNTQSGTN